MLEGSMQMPPVTFLYLTQEDVKRCGGLDMAAYIETVTQAFSLFDKGEVKEPLVPRIDWGNPAGRRFMMHPAYVGGPIDVAGIKWVPANPENPTLRGLPRSHAITILNDPISGYPLAVMDGSLISHMRTGAVAGVGTRYLARPGARTVGLVGAGPIGRTQLWGIYLGLEARVERVHVFDLRPEASRRFCEDMTRRLGLDPGVFRVVDSAEAAVRGADVVGTATNVAVEQRYLRYEWLSPGTLLINTSVRDPEFDVVAKADLVVCDAKKQLHTPGTTLGECHRLGLLSEERVVEMGAIINGRHPGRLRPDEIILFSPIGLGIHDVANAKRIYDVARAQGVGITLRLWDEPEFA